MIMLDRLVSRVESDDRHDAARFERAALEAYGCKATTIRNIIAIHNCNADTAGMIYWTSWGRYQILGSNLYADPVSYAGTFAEYLNDDNDQLLRFEAFVQQRGFHYDDDVTAWASDRFDAFAEFYNGAANFAAYATRMKTILATMEGKTP